MEKDKRYFIVKPSKTRKVYSLACYSTSDDGKRTYHELPEQIQKQVTSINVRFKSGTIEAAEAVTLLKDIIAKQYRKSDVRDMVLKNSTLSAINQKLFNQYWDDEYSARILDDEKSARYDILKAIRLIDPLSLQTATASQLGMSAA